MNRRTLRSAGMALLSILALALAAATLSSPVQQRGGGLGEGGRLGGSLPRTGPRVAPDSFGRGIILLVLAAVLVALLLYGIYYAITNRRHALLIGLTFAVAFALLALVGWMYPQDVTLPTIPSPKLGEGGAGGTGGSGTGPPAPSTPPLLLVAAVVALVVVAAVFLRRRRRSMVLSASDSPDEEQSEAAAMGRAAGDAADRIDEGGDVGNEVYRAWREMTELLSLPASRARTPGEFADAAVEAGMTADDVRELTRLFEDVRYGDDDPTPATERRARDVLRRIEATYAEASEDEGHT